MITRKDLLQILNNQYDIIETSVNILENQLVGSERDILEIRSQISACRAILSDLGKKTSDDMIVNDEYISSINIQIDENHKKLFRCVRSLKQKAQVSPATWRKVGNLILTIVACTVILAIVCAFIFTLVVLIDPHTILLTVAFNPAYSSMSFSSALLIHYKYALPFAAEMGAALGSMLGFLGSSLHLCCNISDTNNWLFPLFKLPSVENDKQKMDAAVTTISTKLNTSLFAAPQLS